MNHFIKKKTVKNFNASSLLRCQSEIRQQFERARYISNVWRNAPTELKPTNCGWIQQGSTYEFKWFEGPQLPVNDVIREEENEESGAEDDESKIDYASDEDEHEQSDCEC
ncbi:hypothetical protein TSAR_005425 [Trichomalopsis sarcophagae]|uniref:Uncharacterized protein n=1 Tax=Trichomalopsis sarcophagae TaxID=543379 RepID=A0A232EE82_9HYME|nr:hypothetical protein TSAR_005425 [Trichomalopsis sarcophagae]